MASNWYDWDRIGTWLSSRSNTLQVDQFSFAYPVCLYIIDHITSFVNYLVKKKLSTNVFNHKLTCRRHPRRKPLPLLHQPPYRRPRKIPPPFLHPLDAVRSVVLATSPWPWPSLSLSLSPSPSPSPFPLFFAPLPCSFSLPLFLTASCSPSPSPTPLSLAAWSFWLEA